jgi:tartrate dehydrogenase/decarboxylase / D-malate dehydrogenase
MRTHRIAVIPGDGIGPEVIPEAVATLQAVAEASGDFAVDVETLDWGSERYLAEGSLMPSGWDETLAAFDAVLVGPVGDPRIPDDVTVWGLILAIRQRFAQYVNLRPIRLLAGVPGPLHAAGPDDVDMVFVRENTEGEYSGAGGRVHRGRPLEVAIESTVFTRGGVERIVRYAFEYARSHDRRQVTSVTKSNAQRHVMVMWDETFAAVAAEYPEIAHDSRLVDAAAARLVTDPASFDVVVTSNLFGDILTDLGAAIAGSLGIAPSANIDPTGEHPGVFQAIHGSAPDIAGRGIANPVGEIWSVALMLDALGERRAAGAVERAIAVALEDPATRTGDLGGRADTAGAGDAVRAALPDALRGAATAGEVAFGSGGA